MSVNSSSPFNGSSTQPPHGFQSSLDFIYSCVSSRSGAYTIDAVTVANMAVVLPLCAFTLYVGHKRWRQQGSSRQTSHSDLFTFHMVLLELTSIVGFTVTFAGIHSDRKAVAMAGISLFPTNFGGQLLFHTLTCVERYLAVVHPVTYLGLRNASGIRIRNISIACVVLFSFGATSFISFSPNVLILMVSYCFVPAALTVMLFCSVSVLCALVHSKPGEAGGVGRHADRTKLRALRTITVILAVLVFRFGGNVLVNVLHSSVKMGYVEQCGVLMSDFFFSLPCSLILPLLFLHKAGELKRCQSRTASGPRSD